MIPLIAAAITAAGSLYSASQQGKAADKAQQASQYATDQSIAAQERALAESRSLNAPYNASGVGANEALTQQLGLGPEGDADWNTYIAANPDVSAVNDIVRGVSEGDEGQRAFVEGFRANALPGENIGAYHARVVGGRPVPKLNTTQTYQQTYDAPTYTPPPAYEAPAAYEPPPAYVAPPRPTQAPLDVGIDKYVKSPDYDYQQSEGTKAVNSGFGAKGLLQSGAAMKALQEFGQNLALGDYSQWRGFTAGRYDTNQNVLDQNYNWDTNFGRTNYDRDRTFGRNNYDTDRQFGRNVYEVDRQYGRNVFQDDRDFGYKRFGADRDYWTERQDAKTSNLFKLVGIGQAAANNTAAAGQNAANNTGNLLTSNANQIGQSSYDRAAANSDAAGAIAGSIGNVLKTQGTSYKQADFNAFRPTFDSGALAGMPKQYGDLSTKIPSIFS